MMPHIQDVTYSEFRKLVQEKKVKDLVITPNIIQGKLEKGAANTISALRGDPVTKKMFKTMEEEGHSFSTLRLEDPNLINILTVSDIRLK